MIKSSETFDGFKNFSEKNKFQGCWKNLTYSIIKE